MTVKRPMLWLSASIVAGMYLFALLGAAVSFAVVFCAFIVLCIRLPKRKDRFTDMILVLVFLLFSFGTVRYANADTIKNKVLYPMCNRGVTLTGEIIEEPKQTERYIRFELKVATCKTVNDLEENVNETVSAVMFLDPNVTAPTLLYGDRITAKGTISLPDTSDNIGGFDYAQYLKDDGIFFQSTLDTSSVQVTGHTTHIFRDWIYKFRKNSKSLFDKTFPQPECGVLKAYVLGDTTDMAKEVSASFSDSGLSHVLAVSGSHVAVFLACFLACLSFLRIYKRYQWGIAVLAVVFYVFFTGASVAAIRAGIVCCFTLVAKVFMRRSDPLTAVAESAAILCIINPHVIFDVSFQLSFASTIGILLWSEPIFQNLNTLCNRIKPNTYRQKFCTTILRLFSMGISANIFIVPILVATFQKFSVMSVFSTIVVTPLLTPMLSAGLLFVAVGFIFPPATGIFSGFLYLCAKMMLSIADFFAKLPFATITFSETGLFYLLLYCVAVMIFFFLFIKKNKLGFLVAIYSFAALLAVLLVNVNLTKDHVSVTFINVGQGDCTLIKASGNCDILIDAGGKKNNTSVGKDVVYPYLTRNGVYDIEFAIASHGHEDHINGLIGLMDEMKIKNLLVPGGFGKTEEGQALLKKAEEQKIPIHTVLHGMILHLNNDMTLEAVMPDAKSLALTKEDQENERSLLLRLNYGEISFLFTGDISKDREEYAAQVYRDMLSADVLKVAHHGAATSNSEEFIDAVSPRFAYIPVGKNHYGHPKPEVLQRLATRNIATYRADQHRDVTFYFDKEHIFGIYCEPIYNEGGK